jgi:hypothetical protein
VREHLIVTEGGLIVLLQQMPGNRHDVQGLYALLKTSFTGTLLGDTAYWPRPKKRDALRAKGIEVVAVPYPQDRYRHPPKVAALLDANRHRIERLTSLFNQQFHAHRTLCRSLKHYCARRWTKALAHNVSRFINSRHKRPVESVQHFRLAA